jgi:hypothetical protein
MNKDNKREITEQPSSQYLHLNLYPLQLHATFLPVTSASFKFTVTDLHSEPLLCYYGACNNIQEI